MTKKSTIALVQTVNVARPVKNKTNKNAASVMMVTNCTIRSAAKLSPLLVSAHVAHQGLDVYEMDNKNGKFFYSFYCFFVKKYIKYANDS